LNSNQIKENESVTTLKSETLKDNNIKKEEEGDGNQENKGKRAEKKSVSRQGDKR
jgi:hypothetical protein